MYIDLYFRLLAGNTTPAAGHLFQEVSSLHYFVVRLYSFMQVMKYYSNWSSKYCLRKPHT